MRLIIGLELEDIMPNHLLQKMVSLGGSNISYKVFWSLTETRLDINHSKAQIEYHTNGFSGEFFDQPTTKTDSEFLVTKQQNFMEQLKPTDLLRIGSLSKKAENLALIHL
ncbi:hypothetical protein TNCT_737681 [Trichonephila clavata]|uniref:Uncharacterized protein n=1 Tax=Trichonephila clavata TaxID=2740835 RepID=A0A8X6M329_TRICU|nr:hypothetical protein TNCT_737681 [Trichonephila clavata]